MRIMRIMIIQVVTCTITDPYNNGKIETVILLRCSIHLNI